MKKELHIWMKDNYNKNDSNNLFLTFYSTETALNSNIEIINTTQPYFCSTTWILKGYRIFVHMLDDKVVEIKLGYCEFADREIRKSHNLSKMLLSNVFGIATEI